MASINVAYTCDSNFIEYLAVSIDSLVDTISSEYLSELVIHVVQIGFSAEQKAWLEKVVAARSAAVRLVFHDYSPSGRFNRCKYRKIEIVTLVYYLPMLLADVDRVIFIDADTFFQHDISELWQLDLEGHWVATTPCVLDDESLQEYGKTTHGCFWSAEQTINAGIMLMDLQRMRELSVTRQLEEWTDKYQDLLNLPEQEAIAFNYPIRKLIDHKWNWRGALKYGELYWCAKSQAKLRDYSDIEAAMVHLQHPFRPLNTIINSKYFAAWIRRFSALGLVMPARRPLDFENFLFLMTEDKSVFQGRGTLAYVLLHLPHIIRCAIAYLKYRKSPEDFVFKTITPAAVETPPSRTIHSTEGIATRA